MNLSVNQLTTQLKNINNGLITLARYYSVKMLSEPIVEEKVVSTEKSYLFINLATLIEDFIISNYHFKKSKIKWSNYYHPEKKAILKDGVIDLANLKNETVSLENKLFHLLKSFLNETQEDILALPAKQIISLVISQLSKLNSVIESNDFSEQSVLSDEMTKETYKALNGPKKVELDKVYEPTYSWLDKKPPSFGDNIEETVPYFWTLSSREVLASELCALSVIEYDNLPLAFYHDMLKQSWDEARHAVFYLNLAITFFPALKSILKEDSELLKVISRYEKTRTGLPIPKEKNLYEAVYNATLEERLILMNIKTEALAVGRLTREMETKFCKKYPEVAIAFEYDKRDEMSHARYGLKWINYLLPDKDEQKRVIEETELLRGVLMLTSIAEYSDIPLEELLGKYSKESIQYK